MRLLADTATCGRPVGRSRHAAVGRGVDPVRIVPVLCCLTLLFARSLEADVKVAVEVEELVTTYQPAGNGAGPTWCYGSTCVVRDGEDVYVSSLETGKDVPLLCNTRWQLWKRGEKGWKLVRHEERFRQREPCPLALFTGGPLFMSVNPSLEPPGVKYGRCQPQVLEFDTKHLDALPKVHLPRFEDGNYFTDHSYRGFAADGRRGELVLFNINAKTSAYFISYRDRDGAWHPRGTVKFPIRACYPEIVLKDKAVHVLAIGDIVEPVEAWRKLKWEKTHRKWDYVFRRLFYTYTSNIDTQPFIEPVEVDTVERTCGHITNLDLYVDREGTVHLLYLKQPYANKYVHDAYFPDAPMTSRLEYVLVRDGRVIRRRTLAETVPPGKTGFTPGWSRFHIAPGGTLYVIAYGTRVDGKGPSTSGNFIAQITPGDGPCTFHRIDLDDPFLNFFTNTPRGGSEPSRVIDLFGTTAKPGELHYARIRLK